ncbi:MAG: hypothetical protein GY913_16525 [Proteobacteria bacterium]|nr:hypothetical protein [Pseudomonadota bacterium]MCP4918511.1 hypothetical protein [Pseudomonadota bacterium]
MFSRLVAADCAWAVACVDEVQDDPYGQYHCVDNSHIGPVIRDDTPFCLDWCAAREYLEHWEGGEFSCDSTKPGLWGVFYVCEERNY